MFAQKFHPSVIPPADQNAPAYWYLFRGSRLLVERGDGDAAFQLPLIVNPAALGMSPLRSQYLGRFGDTHCYSAELSEDTAPPGAMAFHGLRQLYEVLPDDLFWIGARAVQVVAWDRDHQYCGRCATPTVYRAGERCRECPGCGLSFYPRLAPAVIMLVRNGERLLLARAHRHPAGFYSVLAGFVEPGETLEEAVAREVYEEVGIQVKDIRYFGSQPWPFPNSLMLAFVCDYAGGEIRLEEAEIADAGWYNVDEMPRIPPSISVARQLIDWFVAAQRA
jgi:NAD+ diphosphatase